MAAQKGGWIIFWNTSEKWKDELMLFLVQRMPPSVGRVEAPESSLQNCVAIDGYAQSWTEKYRFKTQHFSCMWWNKEQGA